jgi:drug/metabolite transporter (DMT)-like permease
MDLLSRFAHSLKRIFLAADLSIQSAGLSLLYGVLSIAMVFTNKYLLGRIEGDSDLGSYMILIVQCTIAWAFIGFGGISSDFYSLKASLADLAFICLVNVAFIGTILANVNTLRYLSVHMVTLLKNSSIIVTALGDWLFLKNRLSGLVWISLFLIFTGSSCGVLTDLQFSLIGYFWMLISWCSSSGYILLTKVLLSGRNIHFFTILFWNNLLSTVFLGLWVLWRFTEPLKSIFLDGSMQFGIDVPFLFFSGVLGLALNLSTFWLLGFTSATSYGVVGVSKKIVQTVLSLIFFRKSVSLRNGLSVCVGLCGSTLYAFLKWWENEKLKAPKYPLSA